MARTRATNQLGIGLIGAIAGSCFGAGTFVGATDHIYQSPMKLSLPAQPEQERALSFDEINFPIEAISGSILLKARGGWVWQEGETHRIVLDRDVDVTLAQHRFLAASANLWIRKLGSDTERGTTQYQIYAVFEDMRSQDGTITMKAKQLPVRGVIEVTTPISLELGARFDERPRAKTAAFAVAQRTEAIYAQRVLGGSMPEIQPEPARPWSSAIAGNDTENGEPNTSPTGGGGLSASMEPSAGPIFQSSGVFSVAIGGRIVIDGASAGTGSTITADGGVTIQYQDPANRQWIDFKAERVVIYTAGDEQISGVSRLETNQIEGIYLEGGVYAGDDQWAVRAPRMYLDVVNNKAFMIDAVFWTTDQKTSMPLYVRAQSVRQIAKDEFTARKAKISNSAFFEPDLTIGISDIKVTLKDVPATSSGAGDGVDTQTEVAIEGRHVTLNAGPVPILWLPGFKGDPSSFPLRQITVEDTNRSGTAIKTRWNLLSLLKIDGLPGVKVDFNLDYYADRGLGVGVEGTWATAEHRGGLFSYLLVNDNGTDITPSGKRLTRDGENRGMFAFNDVWRLTKAWTVVTELSYISDEAFVPALFRRLGNTTEDYRNRLQLERQGDNNYFAFEVRSPMNDFIVPEHLLQSPGYQVSKVPEARFVALAKDLLPEYKPGLLTYSFEARAGILRLNFSEVSAREYGFTNDTLAGDAFGTTAGASLGDKFRAMGLDESSITRLDTRHELRARFDLGPIRVVPFAVGRVTTYDNSFSVFSPSQTDDVRYWGGGGVTLSTTISKINNDAESRFFDVHRLRHIIEPSVTIWGADSSFDPADVPIFDDDVEGLLVGTSLRAAVDQTWQTKRGGIGRWRDVDLLKVRSEYVTTSKRAGRSPIPQYFSTRPELSNPGEFFATSMIWQPTEVLALAGEVVYDLDTDSTARASIGAIIQHRPGFTTSVEYREVQPLDATFASITARYRLTDKYAMSTGLNYNFDLNNFQNFNAQILRRFQIGSLGATISYDNIRGQTSFGFVFRPAGSRRDLPVDSSWGG
jgi:LPS transport system D